MYCNVCHFNSIATSRFVLDITFMLTICQLFYANLPRNVRLRDRDKKCERKIKIKLLRLDFYECVILF